MDLTGRLVKLRAFGEADVPAIVSNLADAEVTRHLASWAWGPYSAADAREFVFRRDPSVEKWAIECLEDGTLIGAVGLHDLDHRNRHCVWGIWTGPPSRWGRGYGSEACRLSVGFAFRQLGMEKVYLEVDEANERGRRTYERCGFAVEGVLPRHRLHDGRLIAVNLMAAYRDHPLYS